MTRPADCKTAATERGTSPDRIGICLCLLRQIRDTVALVLIVDDEVDDFSRRTYRGKKEKGMKRNGFGRRKNRDDHSMANARVYVRLGNQSARWIITVEISARKVAAKVGRRVVIAALDRHLKGSLTNGVAL